MGAVSHEAADERYVALDLKPVADLDAVRSVLDRWVEAGTLDYETCEARVPGSFDAELEDERVDPPAE